MKWMALISYEAQNINSGIQKCKAHNLGSINTLNTSIFLLESSQHKMLVGPNTMMHTNEKNKKTEFLYMIWQLSSYKYKEDISCTQNSVHFPSISTTEDKI